MGAITAPSPAEALIESPRSWLRLGICLLLGTIGNVGMWSFVVAIPAIQTSFDVSRGDAALAYTLTMIGFGLGGVAIGRLVDRFSVALPVLGSAIALGGGYFAAAHAPNLQWFAIAQGLIGIGSAATFGPLISDISHWFLRRRGIAVAICAAGNYLAGTIWPPVVQHFIATAGWRATYDGVGAFCIATMIPLALTLRAPAPKAASTPQHRSATNVRARLGLSPHALQLLLFAAGVACCVAMAMPQVHIVAYCGDLGYGVANGARMLSLMLGFGIVSRIASGFVADRIGGLATLLLGSSLQGLALIFYLHFDSLVSLYVISALFGLFQGGIVPSYAIIIREYFPAEDAGTRLGIVLLATLLGMALGGWMSGAIFDYTGSYEAAFANGILWDMLNVSIALWLLLRARRTVFA